MIDAKLAAESIGRLAILKYFPAGDDSRAEIMRLVCDMATTNEQVDWLVSRARSLWNEWEGPRELRAVFCSKYKPADGIEAHSQLERFADGIPSEKETMLALPAVPMKQLAAGEPVSAAPSLQTTISDLARAKDLNRAIRGAPPGKVAEIPVRRITQANAITQADIDRAVEEIHEKQAKAEINV